MIGELRVMDAEKWKTRAVACDGENKRLAGELKQVRDELEKRTKDLLDTRSHIQAAALGYQWNKINDPNPAHLRRVDHQAKIMDCRRLFDIIEALENRRMQDAIERSEVG